MPGSFAFSSPDTSRTLLSRVRQHDKAAWERFVRIYGPLIYSWCQRAGLQSSDAADVMQNVFAQLHQKLDKFEDRPANGSFGGWLRTVTRNKIADFFRASDNRAVQNSGVSQAAAQFEQSRHLDESVEIAPDERQILIQRALQLLKTEFEPKTWDMFWRVTVLQERPKEVAEELELSVAAVYQAKSRVMRRARQDLGPFLD